MPAPRAGAERADRDAAGRDGSSGKVFYLSAMQQCTSTFPSPVLGSSSLSIYPPIVSANNRALHIYSISHLSILERATKHQ